MEKKIVQENVKLIRIKIKEIPSKKFKLEFEIKMVINGSIKIFRKKRKAYEELLKYVSEVEAKIILRTPSTASFVDYYVDIHERKVI